MKNKTLMASVLLALINVNGLMGAPTVAGTGTLGTYPTD